jgi:tRNA A-37 threonylcarbamoyl transferase component Bud32
VRTFGKFRLLEPLASGGMADVWRAEVMLAQGVVKEVALKLVRGEHRDADEFARMFVEEARLACRLSHANVVQVFEFAEVDGRYYLAMELVRGRHLGQVVERAREQGLRLGLPRAVHVAAEAAKALAYVHRLTDAGQPLGLVHRDVSPHNLLVSFEGEVKLADFGIARAMTLAGATEPGTLKGKLAYMAPEQASGGPVDARADIFALGVVLWELCAGRRLFARDSEAATLAAVLSGPPPSAPSAWNEAVPPELDAIVLGALARDPARRTASAEELSTALSALLLRIARSPQEWDLRTFMQRLWSERERVAAARGEPTLVRSEVEAAVPPPAPVARAPEEGTAATRTLAPVAGGGRRRAWRALALTAAALLVAGVGAAWLRWAPAVAPPAAPAAPALDPAPGADGAAPGPPAAPAAAPPGGAESAAGAATPAGPGPAEGGTSASATEAAPGAPAPEAAGEGELYVNATPWAQVTVDGRTVGETPVKLRLATGAHAVRVSHPRFGARDRVIDVRAGRRSSWTPKLGP